MFLRMNNFVEGLKWPLVSEAVYRPAYFDEALEQFCRINQGFQQFSRACLVEVSLANREAGLELLSCCALLPKFVVARLRPQVYISVTLPSQLGTLSTFGPK